MKKYNSPKVSILIMNACEDILIGSGEQGSLTNQYRPGELLDIQDNIDW